MTLGNPPSGKRPSSDLHSEEGPAFDASEKLNLKKAASGAKVTLKWAYAEENHVEVVYEVEDLKGGRRVAGYPVELLEGDPDPACHSVKAGATRETCMEKSFRRSSAPRGLSLRCQTLKPGYTYVRETSSAPTIKKCTEDEEDDSVAGPVMAVLGVFAITGPTSERGISPHPARARPPSRCP